MNPRMFHNCVPDDPRTGDMFVSHDRRITLIYTDGSFVDTVTGKKTEPVIVEMGAGARLFHQAIAESWDRICKRRP